MKIKKALDYHPFASDDVWNKAVSCNNLQNQWYMVEKCQDITSCC